ncbi:putative membrane protein [Azospirillum brasilense]|uniref:Putative membrane protein n=1 Tax=Azospirillum brasilense TaxID=192 RepID=A0A560BNI8_AZOBR|nr:heparan-alpha-glucosaminide N-acetyltransferase [Azospirillum brasilense]TWA74184.1 putative membrane protein [Azospirillum brasilense]
MPILSHSPTSADPAARRIGAIDTARGVALLAMAVYHGSWDLTYLGLADFDLFGDPLWLAARTGILGSFLMLSGLSLVLAAEGGISRRRFLRRFALLVLAAGGVSAVSLVLFPDSPIFFGVLHHMAVASLLGLALLRLPWPVLLLLGVAVIAVGETVALPLFDTPWLRWIGLMTFAPESNDYVPLFPWFGGFLFGMALGRLWRPGAAGTPGGAVGHGFAWAGRHSLAVYLLHQPILFGLLSLLAMGIGADPADVRSFQTSCVATCTSGGGAVAHCTATCRCVSDDLSGAGLWSDFVHDRLTADGARKVDNVIQSCGNR